MKMKMKMKNIPLPVRASIARGKAAFFGRRTILSGGLSASAKTPTAIADPQGNTASPKNLYTFYQKPIYLLPKTYIPFLPQGRMPHVGVKSSNGSWYISLNS
jgi:hypothetical protein